MPIQRISLKEDGSFSSDPKKVFYAKLDDTLQIKLLSSKKSNSLVPILVTSANSESKKSKSKLSDQPEVTKEGITTLGELREKYTVINGDFDCEGSWSAYLQFNTPGPVFLQVVFLLSQDIQGEKSSIQAYGRPEWIIVEPVLKIAKKIVSHKELIVQTLISKCMGPIDRWEELIKQQTSLNYNAFHLTPIQKLGYSNSCYSIKDQLDYSVINFPNMSKEEAYTALKEKIRLFEAKYKAIFLIDILLNHTSFDSPWLVDHPESCYNTDNTPALTSAYVLDKALADFSNKIANKECHEYPETSLSTEHQLDKIMNIIKNQVIPSLKLEKYFLIDEQAAIEKIKSKMSSKYPNLQILENPPKELTDPYNHSNSIRFANLINKSVQNLGAAPYGATFEAEKICELLGNESLTLCFDFVRYGIRRVNDWNCNRAKQYLEDAVRNIRNAIHYHRVQGSNHDITPWNSLVIPYFTDLQDGKTKAAHNGWMFNYDVLEDFADSDQFYFLRRLVIPWGDLVKLKYGKSKQDSPYLWKRMKKHVVEMASVFQGFRLDNAHSTPLHVAEYLIRKARKQNPSLFVFAELFTGNKDTDALFTKRIGLNALLRAALHAQNPADLAKDIYEMSHTSESIIGGLDPYTEINHVADKITYDLKPTTPHPIYYDLTHDDQIYMNVRTFRDALPTSSLVCMTNCLIATTKGHDEFYKEKISVTSETRLYSLEDNLDEGHEYLENEVITHLHLDCGSQQSKVEVKGSWDDWTKPSNMYHLQNGAYAVILRLKPGKYEFKYIVNGHWFADFYREFNEKTGNHFLELKGRVKLYPNITKPRQQLNLLHQKICSKYSLFHSYLVSQDVFVVRREKNSSLKSLVLITRSAFRHGIANDVNIVVDLPGIIDKVKMIYYVRDELKADQNDAKVLTGMKGVVVEETDLHKFASINLTDSKASQIKKYHSLKFKYMPPSFVCVLKLKLFDSQTQAINALEEMQRIDQKELYQKLIQHLDVVDINHLFFSSSKEEMDKSGGKIDVYSVPGYGPLPYAGLGGVLKLVHCAQRENNLAGPLFDNLRNGDWLLDYTVYRLSDNKNLSAVREWMSEYITHMKILPRHLIPKYFVRLVNIIHQLIQLNALSRAKSESLNVDLI